MLNVLKYDHGNNSGQIINTNMTSPKVMRQTVNFYSLSKSILYFCQLCANVNILKVPFQQYIICSCLVMLTALRHRITHSLSGMVQHLLPGRVKVPLVFLHQPLFSQGDGLFGSPKHFSGSLEVLCCPLGLKLSLGNRHRAA